MKGIFYSPIVSAKTPFISTLFFFFPDEIPLDPFPDFSKLPPLENKIAF